MVIYLEKYRKAKATHREDRAGVNADAIAIASTMSCFEHRELSPRRCDDLARVDFGNDIVRIQALVTQY